MFTSRYKHNQYSHYDAQLLDSLESDKELVRKNIDWNYRFKNGTKSSNLSTCKDCLHKLSTVPVCTLLTHLVPFKHPTVCVTKRGSFCSVIKPHLYQKLPSIV